MKKRVLVIGSAAVLLVLAAGAGGLYAYDSSRSDVIAKGITAGGVDVGGLSTAQARDVLQRSLGPKLGQGVALTLGPRHWTLPATDIDARLGVDRMVREALNRSREGTFLGRAVRDLRGGEVRAAVPMRIAHSRQKLYGFIDVIAREIDKPSVSCATRRPFTLPKSRRGRSDRTSAAAGSRTSTKRSSRSTGRISRSGSGRTFRSPARTRLPSAARASRRRRASTRSTTGR